MKLGLSGHSTLYPHPSCIVEEIFCEGALKVIFEGVAPSIFIYLSYISEGVREKLAFFLKGFRQIWVFQRGHQVCILICFSKGGDFDSPHK